MTAAAGDLFTDEEVERGRRYARPLYAVRLATGLLSLATLAALAWTPVGDAVSRALGRLPWPLETWLFTAVCLLAVTVVTSPPALWAGLFRERRFGLSTQTLRGWLIDRAKGLVVGVVLAGGALTGLAGLVRATSWWPLAAALAGGALVVAVGFLAPVVLEPLFNRFRPLADEELAAQLRRLAGRAGAPVREVLVADASRRTRKLNAYVSGVAATRRVVLFDTLLERASPAEVEAVVAHELAHRRGRHVERLTALGVAAVAAGVVVLWLVLGASAADPRRVPHVLLLLAALQLALSPAFAWISRRYERVADRTALELTGDAAGLESMFRTLAEANVADLAPPRLLHVLFASHPTIPERIRAVRAGPGRVPGTRP